jgi:hypothetical protein
MADESEVTWSCHVCGRVRPDAKVRFVKAEGVEDA